ncbi:MAG: hypothetical protein O2954_20965 [bacterium]|nr:hypothetical protein [bacterium]
MMLFYAGIDSAVEVARRNASLAARFKEQPLHVEAVAPVEIQEEGRCRQALAWVRARGITRFIWQVLDQSPELAPVMAQVLADADETELAESVKRRMGLRRRQHRPKRTGRLELLPGGLSASGKILPIPSRRSL